MAKLSDEEKNLIRAEFDKCAQESEDLITENKKVLADITFYRWAFRGIVGLILGGSIAGVLLIPAWVDSLISARAKAIEDLVIANADLQSGDYIRAYDNISKFMSNLGVRSGQPWDLSKLSDAQKGFFFSTLVGVFAYNSNHDLASLSEFRSKDRWKAMLADEEFNRIFPADKNGYSDSPILNFYMGLGYLRYADNEADLEQARRYLDSVISATKTTLGYTSTYIGAPLSEAAVLVLQGKKEQAVSILASDPGIIQSYSPFDLTYGTASSNTLVGDFYDELFKRLWGKFSKSDLGADLCDLIKLAYVEVLASGIQEIKDLPSRKTFIAAAISAYAEVHDSIERGEYDKINSRLARRLPGPPDRMGAYLKTLVKLDTSQMSASIYTAGKRDNAISIVVRFFPIDRDNKSSASDSCAKKNPRENREEFWTFEKFDTADQDWRLSFYGPPTQ